MCVFRLNKSPYYTHTNFFSYGYKLRSKVLLIIIYIISYNCNKNGKNIYPEEVEYYLNDNPLISESMVLGIHKDNDDDIYVNAQI